jgi:hypothetical protein
MTRTPSKTAIASNAPSAIDRVILRTSAAAGYAVNNAQAAAAIAPIGYQTARAKHDLSARIAAAQAYANQL